MKVRIGILFVALLAAAPVRSAPAGYAYCGTYGSYVLLYQSVDQLEELGHLRCGEKVEVLTRWVEYFQVRTQDGRVGWVHYAEISNTPGGASTTNFGMTDASAPHAPVVPPLTNVNIMKMHVMRLSADVIIAKIHGSPCEFDTSPAALQKLKQAGLPDKVILAMVQAPAASAPPPAPKAPEIVEVKVPGGTPIEVELSANVSSDTTQDAMIVPMKVAQDVVVNGVMVFQRGAEAHAQVTSVRQPGFMNRPPGEISWTMQYVTAVTGEHIAATFFSKEAAGNPMTSIMGATGPTWEFRKGKPAVVAAGQRFDAVIRGAVLKIPQSVVAAQALASSAAQPPAQAMPAAAEQPASKP